MMKLNTKWNSCDKKRDKEKLPVDDDCLPKKIQ